MEIAEKTYYEILCVPKDATVEEIKLAYKEMLLKTHPDKTKKIVRTDIIAKIKQACTVLSSPRLRQEYDVGLEQSFKKNGLISTGDGLDIITLDDFNTIEQEDETLVFTKDCPRCTAQESFKLSENDLDSSGTPDGLGGYEIIVQCNACSLWLKVRYFDLLDEK